MNPMETTLSSLPPSPPVTDQEFYLFHSIERKVYTWLIGELRRDPIESAHVMAFWMWLEREAHDSTMIERMLDYPGEAVNKLADETVVCLHCLTNEQGFFHEELTHLPNFMPDPSTLSLRFLHENRTEVARRITKILSTVCARAFVYITRSAMNGEPLPLLYETAAMTGGLPGDYIHMQCDQMLDKRFGDALLLNQIDSNQEKEQEEVEDFPVDRTVFLRFPDESRLTANEIREFFTSICGEVIEKLTMREDALGVYALMVVRSAAVANGIHGGAMRKLYVVNGNRVRTRRHVKQQQLYSSTMSPWDEFSILERGHER